jgi:colanic acid/amylovoran biosynthesis glycosyltransferase
VAIYPRAPISRKRAIFDGSLLLDLGVPFLIKQDKVHIEAQAHNGVLRWLDNFSRITICAPSIRIESQESSMRWISADALLASGRLSIFPFPWAYEVRAHFRYVGRVRRTIRELIAQHQYLCFSNLGWLGTWGRIAAEEAYAAGRPYAIWLDWVLHEMPMTFEPNPIKRLWRRVQRRALKYLSIRDVSRCTLGLFHGKTVFDAYAKLCTTARVVHDVHLGVADIIPAPRLDARLSRRSEHIHIVYVGRVHEMKGPWLWLDVVQKVIEEFRGVQEVSAEWIGDGPLLNDLRSAVNERGLVGSVCFPGAEMDREKLLGRVRDSDLFVFCHLTPESPRCLIEALMSGLPILGFESAYASDLLGGRSGGTLVPLSDKAALVRAVADCIEQPAILRNMALTARAVGTSFSDAAVFRHRSDLIKEFL